MIKLGIDINDILRDNLSQLEYTYNKYINNIIDLSKNPVTSFNLIEHFPMSSVEELNRFMYQEAALEIFGHAYERENNLINRFNLYIMDMTDFYGHEVIITSREVMTAIPSTFFFLSKTRCQCETIKFVKTYEEQWNSVDILVTANPEVLKCKPEGKIAIKVNTTYNKDSQGDYQINSLFDIMNDEQYIEKIITNNLTSKNNG
jgi:hypothetical protein